MRRYYHICTPDVKPQMGLDIRCAMMDKDAWRRRWTREAEARGGARQTGSRPLPERRER